MLINPHFSDVENYAEKGVKAFSVYESSTRIISSSICYSEKFQTMVVILGCQDNSIVLLGARFLTFLQKITIQFHLSDIKTEIGDVGVTCTQATFFDDFSIDCLYTAGGSLFIGFNRGYTKEYSLKDFIVKRTYNPLHFIIDKEKLSNFTKSISIETVLIPGIDIIRYSIPSGLVFINHKRISSNLYHRVFTLDSTPIHIYDINGEPKNKLEGFVGNILSAEILENRSLYMCLSSEKNQIYIWDFKLAKLVGKINCIVPGINTGINVFYTKMTIHEFDLDQRFQPVDSLFEITSTSRNADKIEGDILFTISSNGEILISALRYDETNLKWAPLKSMNVKYSEEDKKDKKTQIQMNVQSKSMTCILYDKKQDSLYFADQESNVTMIKNILKLTFTKASTA